MNDHRLIRLLLVVTTVAGLVSSASATPGWRCVDGRPCPSTFSPRMPAAPAAAVAHSGCCGARAANGHGLAISAAPVACVLVAADHAPASVPPRGDTARALAPDLAAPARSGPAVPAMAAARRPVARADNLPPLDQCPKRCRAPRAPPVA